MNNPYGYDPEKTFLNHLDVNQSFYEKNWCIEFHINIIPNFFPIGKYGSAQLEGYPWAAQVRFFGGSNELKKLIPLSIHVLSVAFDTLHFLMSDFREIYRNCSIGDLSFICPSLTAYRELEHSKALVFERDLKMNYLYFFRFREIVDI